eukprot:5772256-Pyramimonas_sp.AAC.1
MKACNGDWSNSCRCSACNSLRGRVGRTKARDVELQAGRASLDVKGREEFFTDSAGLFNADLKAALTTAIAKSVLDRLTSRMQAEGAFEDFDDLKSKMEKKEFEELCQK